MLVRYSFSVSSVGCVLVVRQLVATLPYSYLEQRVAGSAGGRLLAGAPEVGVAMVSSCGVGGGSSEWLLHLQVQ